jgi:electron-transferring-flavoprotein dehydrogenase
LTEGGYQSVPKLSFPGGALTGCDAGFMNVPRIKGSHNAMLSGIMAAEAAAAALASGRSHDELVDYDAGWRQTAIGQDLWKVRNAKPLWSKFGTLGGIMLGGLDMWTNTVGFSVFGTLGHDKPDYASLKPAPECAPVSYPKPDGKITFDRLSSVFLSNTNHEEDQPVHLHVADLALQKKSEHDVFAGPSARYCPADVYEWVNDAGVPKPAISRTQTRTLPGFPPKAAEGRTIQICDQPGGPRSRSRHTGRAKLVPFALRDVLAVAAQKGHSRRHIRWFARTRATATSLEHRQ